MNTITESNVRLIASPRAWIEGEALRQFFAVARREGVRQAVGFPDLHPGRGAPVGAAYVTDRMIYPRLIGGDIGCGMALFKTNLLRREARLDRWAALPFQLEHPWDEFVGEFLVEQELESTEFDQALGTIGGGNHFAELQTVEQVFDPVELRRLGIRKEQLVVLVHSGSRGLGETVLDAYEAAGPDEGVPDDTTAARAYLAGHDQALRWAHANRELLARRFAMTLGTVVSRVWDGCHNSITRRELDGESVWIHRKGAVAAENDPVVIPGSRGSLSYLVLPVGDGESHAWSLAHGAGRKWSRSEARLRMRERFGPRQLTQTAFGGHVICEERELLYEEAPDAYKSVEAVVRDLVDAGLISVIATFQPLLTYKTRKLRR